MTQRELKKLSRRQLLELLLVQTERADQLQKQLEEARSKLEERRVAIVESGSLAEAALKLSGIFEAADEASRCYLENLQQRSRAGSDLEAEASARAQAMVEEAERKCRQLQQEADDYYAQAQERIQKQCQLLSEIFGKGKET